MGQIKTNWLLTGMTGKACSHDDVYTKVNKRTGKCYSVKLCHPSEAITAKQEKLRSEFGIISSALSEWIETGGETKSPDYLKVKKRFDRQKKYSTLRGMMYSKGMAKIDADGNVVIDINVINGTSGSNGSSQSSGTSGTSGSNGKIKLTLSTNNAELGNTTPAGESEYEAGAQVTIKANILDDEAFFDGWSDGNEEQTRTITIDKDVTLEARYG